MNYKKFRPDLYSRLSESTGAEITVDLSKSLVWRSSRGRNPWKGDRIGTILIVRDSRGVLAAPARAGKSLGKLIRNHLKWMSRLERHTTKLGERGLVIFYEDLCSHPARVMQQVCAFLGIQFEAAMLGIADRAHHFIHSSTSGYLKGGNEIRLDERWRRELDDVRVAEIEAMMRKLPLLRDRYLGDG